MIKVEQKQPMSVTTEARSVPVAQDGQSSYSTLPPQPHVPTPHAGGRVESVAKAAVVAEETQTLPPTRNSPAKTPSTSSPPEKGKVASIWARLKRVKNIEIYAAGLVVLIMIAIYASSFLGGTDASGQNPHRPGSTDYLIHQRHNQFARDMEARLVSTLSQVRGAGNVQAMVTVVGSATIEIAYNIDERTVTQGGTTTTTVVKTPVIIQGSGGPQPLILLEIKPQLTGVVVVAEGAHNVSVRLQLLRAVQALVGDPNVNIEILSGR